MRPPLHSPFTFVCDSPGRQISVIDNNLRLSSASRRPLLRVSTTHSIYRRRLATVVVKTRFRPMQLIYLGRSSRRVRDVSETDDLNHWTTR
jgi:hypothetical protein